jgi:hypothetical protein
MQSNTLFVVGAGASSEALLPMARQLADNVALKLNIQPSAGGKGDPKILDVIQQYAHTHDEINVWLKAATLIRQGVVYSNSIDSFIDTHKNDENVQFLGKLAIAATILESERVSHLYVDETVIEPDFRNVDGVKQTWFVSLFRSLADGIRKSELDRIFEKVSFVVFNYDRCIEHFFYNALQKKYGISASEASDVMSTLKIYHPYGTIAPLKWQSSDSGIPYGFDTNRANLIAMANNIKTYSEQVKDTKLMENIHNEVQTANTLVFLGFSYHLENMKLLAPGIDCDVKRVFGTAFNISGADRAEILRDIWALIRPSGPLQQTGHMAIRNELTCATLIQQFSRSLFITGNRSAT